MRIFEVIWLFLLVGLNGVFFLVPRQVAQVVIWPENIVRVQRSRNCGFLSAGISKAQFDLIG